LKPFIVLVCLAVILAVTFLLAASNVESINKEQGILYPSGYLLPLNFAHADHVDQQCVECHHNFIDDTGGGLCLDCHKTDPEVSSLIEEQFHDLCRNCHIEQQVLAEAHGPTRECIACHIRDDRP